MYLFSAGFCKLLHLCVTKNNAMEQDINTQETTLENTLIQAFAQLSNQVLEFQKSITAREPGNCFPSIKEVGMLCRLINCLAKLKKLSEPFNGHKAILAFATFLGKEDKTLAKTVRTKYKEFQVGTQPESREAPTTESGIGVIAPTPEPPITKAEFDQHRSLLFNLHLNKHHITTVNGQPRNTNWLQYNLFQWHLPRAERRFFDSESDYHSTIDHNAVCRNIKQHFSRHNIKR